MQKISFTSLAGLCGVLLLVTTCDDESNQSNAPERESVESKNQKLETATSDISVKSKNSIKIGTPRIDIYHTSNLWGEIEPCG